MKRIVPILLLLCFFIMSCAEKTDVGNSTIPKSSKVLVKIPDTTVDRSLLHYDNKTSLWTLNGQPYSGYIVSFYEGNVLKEKLSIWKGKKQNKNILWYADGHLKEEANYQEGKLHGEKRRWSSDTSHILIAQLNYSLGKVHGEQKQWYRTGELHKKMNLNMGREDGMQQAFRKNGELYANYEVRNGRTFGLRKASLCYGLEDENIKYEN